VNYPAPSPELDLGSIFPFELDQFQKEAIASLNAGRSVVVCAPTGSGKTLVGEYAIYRALARGKRVFYTTPLKALSNQKLRDFREKFGFDQVGLLTGDASIHRDAPILVMTTEIFRNMLYGTPIGEVGTSRHGRGAGDGIVEEHVGQRVGEHREHVGDRAFVDPESEGIDEGQFRRPLR